MELLVTKELADDSRKLRLFAMHTALCGWLSTITPARFALLSYLLHRTYGEGREATRISIREFGAVNVAESALRGHIHGLIESDFVIAYRTVSGENSHEKESRMYEINCKRLFRGVEPPADFRSPPSQNPHPPSYINNIDSVDKNAIDKTSARSSRSVAKETNVFALPKKPRTVAVRSESASAVIAAVAGKARAVAAGRVERASKIAPHQIDKLELQAIIDKAMKTYHPTGTRVIVTGKEFGMLRKRLREAPPSDFAGFINWTIGQWFTIATQNNVARRKKTGTGQTVAGSAMPMAPEFAALAYRYPYFLKVYANRAADQAAQEAAKPQEDRKIANLQRALSEAQRDKVLLADQLSKVKRRTALPATRVAPASQRPSVDFDEDIEFPSWTSQGAKRRAR